MEEKRPKPTKATGYGSQRAPETMPFLMEVFVSFCFWTLFNEIVSMVWFMAVVQMSFTGYELFLAAPTTTAFLALPRFRAAVFRRPLLPIIVGLLGFLGIFMHEPSIKLCTIAISLTGLMMSRFAACFLEKDRATRDHSIQAFALGLIVAVVVRRYNHSLNPFVMFELLAALIIVVGFSLTVTLVQDRRRVEAMSIPVPSQPGSNVSLGILLGSLLFFVQYFVSEAAVIPRSASFSVDPWSGIVLVAVTMALHIPYNLVASKSTFALLCASVLIFSFAPGYLCFIGGIVSAVIVAAMVPIVMSYLVETVSNHAVVFSFAMGTYVVITIMNVYASVYKFVPLGFLLRERPWVSMILTLWNLRLPFFSPAKIPPRSEDGPKAADWMENVKNTMQECAQLFKTGNFPRSHRTLVLATCLIAAVMYLVFHLSPVPLSTSVRQPSPLPTMNAMIWNIRYAMDDNGRYSYDYLEEIIRLGKMDIVGLIETDHMHVHAGNRDTTEYLAKKFGWYSSYGPGPLECTFGVAFISRYPIVELDEFPLPSPEGELAPAIEALLDVNGDKIRVFVVHFGNTEDTLDLKLQSEEMARRVKLSKEPVIYLSYITSTMDGVPYTNLINAGLKDPVPLDVHRYCEYVLYKGLEPISYLDHKSEPVTDTEAEMIQFLLKDPKETRSTSEMIKEAYPEGDDIYTFFDFTFPHHIGRVRSRWGFSKQEGELKRLFVKNY